MKIVMDSLRMGFDHSGVVEDESEPAFLAEIAVDVTTEKGTMTHYVLMNQFNIYSTYIVAITSIYDLFLETPDDFKEKLNNVMIERYNFVNFDGYPDAMEDSYFRNCFRFLTFVASCAGRDMSKVEIPDVDLEQVFA